MEIEHAHTRDNLHELDHSSNVAISGMKSSFSSQQDNHDDMIHDINTCQSDIDTLNKKCEHLSVAVNLKQITDVITDNNIF